MINAKYVDIRRYCGVGRLLFALSCDKSEYFFDVLILLRTYVKIKKTLLGVRYVYYR